MALNRIYVGEEVDQRLCLMNGYLDLTPNLLCRLAFCLSLATPGIPALEHHSDGQSREFNRYTLTGQWDSYFFAMLRERMQQDAIPAEELEIQFKAHLNRGVFLLYERLKTLEDLALLLKMAESCSQNINISSRTTSS